MFNLLLLFVLGLFCLHGNPCLPLFGEYAKIINMTQSKWKKIGIAVTERELEMVKIVKKSTKLNSRELFIGIVSMLWDDVPKKYKKKFIEKYEEQKKRVKKKIAEAKRRK